MLQLKCLKGKMGGTMKLQFILVLLMLARLSTNASADVDSGLKIVVDDFPDPRTTNLPPNMKIALESDQTNYFVGENFVLNYRVENVGNTLFKIG